MKEFELEGHKIKLLKREEIDAEKWDKCVEESLNESPMANSWVLDVMHPNWLALVGNEYSWVFPLTVDRFLGMSLYSMPVYMQYLGFFGNVLSLDIQKIFNVLRSRGFRIINFSQTPGMDVLDIPSCIHRTTYYLDLNLAYGTLVEGYSKSCKKNIRRAIKANIKVRTSHSSEFLIKMKEEMVTVKRLKPIARQNNRKFQLLVDKAIALGKGVLYEAVDNGLICASAFFLKGKKRIIIFSASNQLGRTASASFLLIDRFIEDHCLSSCYLDFAGSDIKGIANYNIGYGAQPYKYLSMKKSRLSFAYYLWRIRNI